MTVTDTLGAVINGAKISFSPTKQSRSRTKFTFISGADGNIDSNVIDGIYDIVIKAKGFKKVVLKNQLLPYDPRSCMTIKLKSTMPPHQIT